MDCREVYSWKFLAFSSVPVYAQYLKQTSIVVLYSFKKGWTKVNSSSICLKSQILQKTNKADTHWHTLFLPTITGTSHCAAAYSLSPAGEGKVYALNRYSPTVCLEDWHWPDKTEHFSAPWKIQNYKIHSSFKKDDEEGELAHSQLALLSHLLRFSCSHKNENKDVRTATLDKASTWYRKKMEPPSSLRKGLADCCWHDYLPSASDNLYLIGCCLTTPPEWGFATILSSSSMQGRTACLIQQWPMKEARILAGNLPIFVLQREEIFPSYSW